MSRTLGRLLVWVADALERSLILVPDLDEADAMRRGPYFADWMDTGARRCSRCSPDT
jgi:hypothetical protein